MSFVLADQRVSVADEFVGVIASVIGIAGAGFRLSLILNAVSCEVANAGLEVHSIAKQVTLFSLMLKQVGTVLQAADSVHSQEAVDAAKQIAEESTRVFEEINDMLDRVRMKRPDGTYAPTIQQRFRWCFKKHRVTYLLAQLESLKLSLSVLLQILQLGKLMASTSKNDSPEEVALKTNAIQQERAETQNVVIIRYWQLSKMDRLFDLSQREDVSDRDAVRDDDDMKSITSATSQLTIEPPPEYAPSTAIAKLPIYSFGELDKTLQQIKQSPKDMIRVSDSAIDPLLERWTNWHEIRERKHTRDPGSRFVPSVQNLYEDDEDKPLHQKYRERGDSPRGLYLEGSTTNWREPHSTAARHEAFRRRKEYSGYQPSVSVASSDLDDSSGSKSSKKRSARRHVINSSTESSESEQEKPRSRRRRSSGSPTMEKKIRFPDGTPVAHTYSGGKTPSLNRQPSSGGATPGYSSPRTSWSPQYAQGQQRPFATPDQNPLHHAVSSPGVGPLPPISTANAPNPYSQHGNHRDSYPSPSYHPPPPYAPHYPPPQTTRYMPQPARMAVPPRPMSQHGMERSPSRMSHHSTASGRGHVKSEEEKRASREKTKKNLREGATKGLLGAGAIAGFLEALEGLSI